MSGSGRAGGLRAVPAVRASVRAAAALAAGTVAALAAVFLSVVLAQATGSVLWLLGAAAAVPAAWALSRRAAGAVRDAVRPAPVVELDGDDLLLPPAARGGDRRRVPCRSVSAYRVEVRGRTATLLLWGDWVDHPAGFEALPVGCDDRASAEALASSLARALQDRGVAPAGPPCPASPSAT